MPTIQEALLNTVFISTEQTGTGSSQNIAHGLARAPSVVAFLFTGGTVVTSVVEGTHDATNVVITVTSGAKFKILAWGY